MNKTLENRYAGKTIVVTGVTSGNGRALANLLLALGAVVVGIGRNRERLEAFQRKGGIPYQLDLGRMVDIDQFVNWFRRTYRRCDGLFHLAGTGVIGQVSSAEFAAFQASDLTGPIRLAEGILPIMKRCATVAVVTSGSVALAQGVPELAQYVRVKEGMVKWCARNRGRFQTRGVNLMLIAMGAIGSEIWTTASGFAKPFGWLMRRALPRPERYSELILADAMRGCPATYPGFLAGLTNFDGEEYRASLPLITPAVQFAVRWSLRLGQRGRP